MQYTYMYGEYTNSLTHRLEKKNILSSTESVIEGERERHEEEEDVNDDD